MTFYRIFRFTMCRFSSTVIVVPSLYVNLKVMKRFRLGVISHKRFRYLIDWKSVYHAETSHYRFWFHLSIPNGTFTLSEFRSEKFLWSSMWTLNWISQEAIWCGSNIAFAFTFPQYKRTLIRVATAQGKQGKQEFGSYFFQTGKTQGILFWHREKFGNAGKIFGLWLLT